MTVLYGIRRVIWLGLPSTGIPDALVNGVIVLDNNVAQEIFPGRPIRYPVDTKPRFTSLEKRKYLQNLLAPDAPELEDESLK